MSVFTPNYYFDKIWDITEADLNKMGVSLLILDVDNTLTRHKSGFFCFEAESWLIGMLERQVGLVIVSNSNDEKIKKEAKKRGIAYWGDAKKPLSCGFRRALKGLSFKKSQVAIVGDQLFTDILGGNLFGIKTILVAPIEFEKTCFFKVKRWLEKPFLVRIKKSVSEKH